MSETMFKAAFIFTCLVIFVLGVSLLGAAIMHVRKPEVQNTDVTRLIKPGCWVVMTEGLHGIELQHHPDCPCGGTREK